ncbi:ATP synthase F1 subunit gamma [Fulvivirgaceae bacterium LMO-SS25]
MANLKEVKERIKSVSSTQQITKAMKMVAAAKLRRAQDRIIRMRPYAQRLSGILQNVSSSLDETVNSEFTVERPVENVLIVLITSDRGLCGAFNSNVFKGANRLLNQKYAVQFATNKVTFLPIGKKAIEYAKRRNFNIVGGHSDLFLRLSFDESRAASEYIMDSFVNGKYDRVELVYNSFKNVATQLVIEEQFLPVEKVTPAEGKAESSKTDYLFEPTPAYIVEELIPQSLKIQLYKALLDSNASEHGARMTAMDKATDNAGELLKQLKLTYNRTRQAAITKEILEIVGGAEALAAK